MKNNKLEFETLKSNKNRLYLLCGIVCVVVLLITIIVSNTFAKYRVSDSIPIINSEINYKVPDLNMVSLYVANEEGVDEEADVIPTSGYTLNTVPVVFSVNIPVIAPLLLLSIVLFASICSPTVLNSLKYK